MTRLAKSTDQWLRRERPGYFGRRRDQKIAELDAKHGTGNWQLRWYSPVFPEGLEFNDACILFYEMSYLEWFRRQPDELDEICKYGECIDNAISNIKSGRDYTKQEASSTHIQDIAVRNVLFINNRKFTVDGPLLIIRSSDSNGHKFGPGNIPFFDPRIIEKPSLSPWWAEYDSVEDFWQSNKFIYVKAGV